MFNFPPAPPPKPGVEPVVVEPPNREAEKVERWRVHCLLEAGYDVEAAILIARSNVDLHLAVDIARQGCSPTNALLILL